MCTKCVLLYTTISRINQILKNSPTEESRVCMWVRAYICGWSAETACRKKAPRGASFPLFWAPSHSLTACRSAETHTLLLLAFLCVGHTETKRRSHTLSLTHWPIPLWPRASWKCAEMKTCPLSALIYIFTPADTFDKLSLKFFLALTPMI